MRPSVVSFAASLLLFASVTFAQDARARAEALFQDAKQLMAQKKYTEACAKLLRSQELDPAVGTLLNLALCYESDGRNASAWAAYKQAATLSRNANQPDREKLARERAAAIEPRLSYATINVKDPAAKIEVKLDGNVLDRVEWGVAIPIDPGEHRLEATAPSRKQFSSQFKADEASRSTFEVPVLEEGGPSVPAVSNPPPLKIEPLREAPPPKKGAPWLGVGIGTMAVGAGGIVVGSIFGIMALDTKSALDASCGLMKQCSSDEQSRISELDTRATLSTIGFIAGGVLFAAGLSFVIVPLLGRSSGTALNLAQGRF